MILPEKAIPAKLPRSFGGAQCAHSDGGAGIANPDAMP